MPPELSHSFFFDKAPSAHRRVPKAVSEADRDEWQRRVESYGLRASQARDCECEAPPNPEHTQAARREAQSPCLDYCAESQTSRVARYKVANRVRIYPSGELEVRTVSRGSSSKVPPKSYGPRFTRGVSGNGRRVIRRAVAARVALGDCQVGLYTLSSRALMPDRDFNKVVNSFLAWGRKYLPEYFKDYVMVFELQARGTLHAHMLLFKRIPKGLWRRMRDLWAVKYDMGPGSFDVKHIRRPSRAAAYLCKYLTDKKPSFRLGLDGEGMLGFEPWRVGRNGQPYERIKFHGNAYRVSDALRLLAVPVAEYHLPWGSPLALRLSVNLRGGVQFFTGPTEALLWVSSNLAGAP
jgi:hypothetical protein